MAGKSEATKAKGKNCKAKIILKGNFEYGFTRDERNNQNKRIWAYINGWGNNLYIDLENYDTWNYITLTYGSFTNMNLYLNGILKSSKLFTLYFSAQFKPSIILISIKVLLSSSG